MNANTPDGESPPDDQRAARAQEEREIEEALEESFPASDPPDWTLGREAHEKDASSS